MQTCISEKGRKSADGTEKIEQSRKITFFFLFAWKVQADDSQDAHTFIINVKIGILVQCNFLCFQEHRTLNK